MASHRVVLEIEHKAWRLHSTLLVLSPVPLPCSLRGSLGDAPRGMFVGIFVAIDSSLHLDSERRGEAM